MKIVLAQQNYIIGDFDYNTTKIIAAIQKAESLQADLIVFSELAICGYPPRDFLGYPDFVEAAQHALKRLLPYTSKVAVLVGCPSSNPNPKGKNLFNSAYLLHKKQIVDVIHKSCLPNYDVFDEYRYFEPAYETHVMVWRGMRLAVTICEDIWNLGDHRLYRSCPLDQLITQQPDLIINLSASPFDYSQREKRRQIVCSNARLYQRPLLYCNTVGGQTEILFDGGSLVADASGQILQEGIYFDEDFLLTEWPFNVSAQQKVPMAHQADAYTPMHTLQPDVHTDRIHDALVCGIRDYFHKMGFHEAIVGASGGIDSAVTQALAVEALGRDKVHAVGMPSVYSSAHSVTDAVQLSETLGNTFIQLPIQDIFHQVQSVLQPVFKELPFSLAEENIQARIRGTLLMAMANKFNYVLLNTTNKSECAVGYGTLYGDMAGGLSVLGDVYKTQVYALANYINRTREIIPHAVIEKAPSAELRPEQKDSDSLPPYELLDAILFQYIDCCNGREAMLQMGTDASLLDRILNLVNRSEYKRNQFCPVLRVSEKSFGIGRRLPVVARYTSGSPS